MLKPVCRNGQWKLRGDLFGYRWSIWPVWPGTFRWACITRRPGLMSGSLGIVLFTAVRIAR